MHVLLTRAAEDAARTRNALEARGHRVTLSPVIAIEPTGATWPVGVVDAVLATSAHAFQAMQEGWGPSAEARRLLPLRLVGIRTRDAARDRKFLGPALTAPNAVALVMEMAKQAAGRRIVYLTGRDRKSDIETALSVTEQSVEVVETYRAAPVRGLTPSVHIALEHDTVDAALHFSRRSASLFLEAVRAAEVPSPKLNVCLSEDVAQPLSEAGWRVAVAETSDEVSLIAAMEATSRVPD